MPTEETTGRTTASQQNLKTGARVAMAILLLNLVAQLVAAYQINQQLSSPLIPESSVAEINKPFIFHAIIAAGAGLASALLYYLGKYGWLIALVVLTLVADRFMYF